MRYDFITSVTIKNELGTELAQLSRETPASNTKWLTRQISNEVLRHSAPLYMPTGGENGYITFDVNMDAAYGQFYQSSAVVIAFGLIRSSLLVFFLFIAFYYLLTKPLIQIALQVKQINWVAWRAATFAPCRYTRRWINPACSQYKPVAGCGRFSAGQTPSCWGSTA